MATTLDSVTSPTYRANGHASAAHRELFAPTNLQSQAQTIPPQYLPGGKKSLPGISIRAYCLGIAFGICSLSAAQLAYFEYNLWRIPAFVAILAVFHYLEFDMTARFNPPDGGIGSFLLFNNGAGYAIAHSTAMAETTIRCWLQSNYKPDWLRMPFGLQIPDLLPPTLGSMLVLVGFALILSGQVMRSLAMAHAKTNFNHLVQSIKKSDHVLVTQGVYAFSRHPSYFGFFWWALGTQLVMGNRFCFVIYLVVLWKFFSHRIRGEEKHLVEFFGQDYLTYREKVGVCIPLIR